MGVYGLAHLRINQGKSAVLLEPLITFSLAQLYLQGPEKGCFLFLP